ncbi:MAG: 50S ribosomal protein L25/general stress protein Ctc [Kiloniellales bacterium]
MADVLKLSAEPKERAGKGAARAARRDGRVPGVIYGAKQDPVMITLDPRDLQRELHKGGFFATIFDVGVNGKDERVLARDLQVHPVTDRPLHVDFLRVTGDTEVTVEVPVLFTNTENVPGLKRGGLLNIVRHEVEVICKADSIPHEFTIDLGALDLDIGDSVHASNLSLPPGVRLTITERDFTVATLAAPTLASEEAEAAEAAAVEEGAEAPEGEAEPSEEGGDEEE